MIDIWQNIEGFMPFDMNNADGTYCVGKLREITDNYIEVVMCEPAVYAGSTIREYYPTKFLTLQDQMNVAVSALDKLYLMAKDAWGSAEAYTIINKERERIEKTLLEEYGCTEEEAKKFSRAAWRGSHIYLKKAIGLCILGFVENCGISASARTPYYDGGWGLFLHFAHTAEGKAMGLNGKQYYEVRHLFCEGYIPEQHDKYDIYPLEGKEYVEIILEDMDYPKGEDSEQIQAVCWGVWQWFQFQKLDIKEKDRIMRT